LTALDEAATRAGRSHDAAADTYDYPALAFWGYVGAETVRRVALREGDAVLARARELVQDALPEYVRHGRGVDREPSVWMLDSWSTA
jgi:hypothetical protein